MKWNIIIGSIGGLTSAVTCGSIFGPDWWKAGLIILAVGTAFELGKYAKETK